jgi:hypothetical protein
MGAWIIRAQGGSRLLNKIVVLMAWKTTFVENRRRQQSY